MSACVVLVSWVPAGTFIDEFAGTDKVSLSNLWTNATDGLDTSQLDEIGLGGLNTANVEISTGGSTDYATYSRWKNVFLNDGLPEMWLAQMLISCLHLTVCILGFNHFTKVKVPVLLKRHAREQRRAHNLQSAAEGDSTHTFLDTTVHAFGLPHIIADPDSVKRAFARFGNVVGVRVNNVSKGNNNWALVCFSSAAGPENIRENMTQLTQANPKNNEFETGVFTTKKTVARLQKQEISVKVGMLTEPYVAAFGGLLAEQVEELRYEILSADDESVGYQAAKHAQEVINMAFGSLGRKVPLQTMYLLRWNAQLWGAGLDIALSVGGVVFSPLLFSWHLLRITRWNLAKVVVKSITANLGRIMTTVVLGLLAMYTFAVIAFAYMASSGWF